ncbi:MgtC/SapB family protein [Pontibacillus yanchengensis]|uniref:MgtC/SapB family protein n=1 Tax=Pontibacillus yanchengensis TaxID=462910 RepID=UPI000A432A53
MSLQTFMDDYFIMMLSRLVTAVVLCGVIGFEREIKNRSAGFRTHILVGVGACLMMLLSLYGFDPFLNKHGSIRFDPARIPSYVISGIGFLGAGTIMVHGITIRGLTTAASIWTVAGLGLVIGAGMYGPAILATIVVLVSLIGLNNVEKLVKKRSNPFLKITADDSLEMSEVIKIFDKYHLHILTFEVERDKEGQRNVYIELEHQKNLDEISLFDEVSKLTNVKSVYRHS